MFVSQSVLYICFWNQIYSPFILKFTLSISLSVGKKTSPVNITFSPLCCTTSWHLQFFPKYSTRHGRYHYLDYPHKETRAKGDSGLESSTPEPPASVLSTWLNDGTALLFWHEIISDRRVIGLQRSVFISKTYLPGLSTFPLGMHILGNMIVKEIIFNLHSDQAKMLIVFAFQDYRKMH